MSLRQDLTPLLNARSVAIVGISQPDRFGGLLYRNLESFGYRGKIFGVNPRYESLYDMPIYSSLGELPEQPDCVMLAVPNKALVSGLEEVAEAGIRAAVIFANAHSDASEDGPSLQARMTEIAETHSMAVCGPNCMGFISLAQRLAITGFETNPGTPAGNITFISHSGSVWDAFLQNRRELAFNYIISAGNEMVTTVADYLQFALADETTKAIGLFLETVRDPDTFRAALKEAAEHDIPVVALKTGRSKEGARLTQAHSGALAGEDAAYDALFAHYGVRRVTSLDEMADTLELFSSNTRPPTPYVSAIHDSGGQRALVVDLADTVGIEFAAINEATTARMAAVLEPGLEPINPLDAWGTGNGAEGIFEECVLALDQDPATGLTLFACDLYPMDDESNFYPLIVEGLKDRLQKPLIWLAHLSSTTSDAQMKYLRGLSIPILLGTETALRAVAHFVDYAAFQRARAETGKAEKARKADDALLDVATPANLAALRGQLEESTHPLDEHASKQVLAEYGLTATRESRVDNLGAALEAAGKIGFPVALKTAGGDLHKTEKDGIRLDLPDEEALSTAYRDFEARLGPEVLVQEMVPEGVELILGIVNDPQFGPLLTLGSGGIFVEVMKDIRMLMLPTSADRVRAALESLRGAALLRGVRGRPPADLDAVVGAALGLAALARDLGDLVSEIDINPLRALPDRAVVVDALIVPR